MSGLLGASWRCFDRAANDSLVDAEALEASPALGRLARHGIGGWPALALVLLIALAVLPLTDSLAAAGLRP